MDTLKGTLVDIVFHNDENGYTIFDFETDDKLLTAVGSLVSPSIGLNYELTGELKIHPKYGEQFVFTEGFEILPTDADGIKLFLASGIIKGIGPKVAALIVDKFREKTLEIIEKEPDRLCEISGIGNKTATKIAKSYKEHQEFANISIFFQSFGIAPNQSLKLFKAYGKDAVTLIEENPYRLTMELSGYGFKKADEIAHKLGIPNDSPSRIESAIKYCLNFYVSDGNTFVPQELLCEKVSALLDLGRELINDTLVSMAISGDIKLETINNEKVVYLYAYYFAEQKVCSNMLNIVKGELKQLFTDVDKSISLTEERTGILLSETQKNAVKNSISSGISIITGGPGTGKTTIINTIINLFQENNFTVAISAPTGRAAKRISETSRHEACTIHRLLDYFYSEGLNDMIFGKNEDSPLDFDVIIVDEASMIDLMLMKGLTDAITPGTRLILVGDSDQLPSVGAGNVLRDLITSGFVRTSSLKDIYRQTEESKIIINAHKINNGEYPYLNGSSSDFFFMERGNEKDIANLIVNLVKERLPNYYDVNPLNDIQVLTPTRKGVIGTFELNTLLQNSCNPPSPTIPEKKHGTVIFRQGDKVMQIKNNYELKWFIPGTEINGTGVFNGDMGFIIDIDKEYGTLTVLYDGEKYVDYEFNQLDEIELAYAITVHKSQGSEFPIVIMPISWFPPMLATRNLLYTGITRGKKTVVLVGSQRWLTTMIDNDRIKLRYSGLADRLEEVIDFQISTET